jgi:predicted dehydrogenase
MADKIRLGFVGANVRSTWASQSHFPALLASPDVELTAVCTTRPESADLARSSPSTISGRWWPRRRLTRWPWW